jgi:hypothetical protein
MEIQEVETHKKIHRDVDVRRDTLKHEKYTKERNEYFCTRFQSTMYFKVVRDKHVHISIYSFTEYAHRNTEFEFTSR